jgi:hypothetical protein
MRLLHRTNPEAVVNLRAGRASTVSPPLQDLDDERSQAQEPGTRKRATSKRFCGRLTRDDPGQRIWGMLEQQNAQRLDFHRCLSPMCSTWHQGLGRSRHSQGVLFLLISSCPYFLTARCCCATLLSSSGIHRGRCSPLHDTKFFCAQDPVCANPRALHPLLPGG